jgi:hypothetical protein
MRKIYLFAILVLTLWACNPPSKIMKNAALLHSQGSFEEAYNLLIQVKDRSVTKPAAIAMRNGLFDKVGADYVYFLIQKSQKLTQQGSLEEAYLISLKAKSVCKKTPFVTLEWRGEYDEAKKKAYNDYTKSLFQKAKENYDKATKVEEFDNVSEQFRNIIGIKDDYPNLYENESSEYISQAYQKTTEIYFKKGTDYLQSATSVDDFNKARYLFDQVIQRNKYPNIYLDDAKEKILICNNSIADLKYKDALKRYQTANSVEDFQAAFETFQVLTKDPTQPSKYIDDMKGKMQISYNKVTQMKFTDAMEGYQEASATPSIAVWEKSYQEFSEIAQRTLYPSPLIAKAKTYQIESYNQVTDLYYVEALKTYESAEYRNAYKKFQFIEKRQQNYKNTTQLKAKSFELGTVEVYVSSRYVYGNDLFQFLKSNVQNEFVRLSTNPSAKHVLTIEETFDINDDQYNPTSRDFYLYIIERLSYKDTSQKKDISYYAATRAVVCREVKITKRVTCNVLYRISASSFSDRILKSTSDEGSYYQTSYRGDLRGLSERSIQRTDYISPLSDNMIRRFNAGSMTLRNTDEMKSQARKEVYEDVKRAVLRQVERL